MLADHGLRVPASRLGSNTTPTGSCADTLCTLTPISASTPVIVPPTVTGDGVVLPYAGRSTVNMRSSVPTTSQGAYLPEPERTRWMMAAVLMVPFGSLMPTATCASPPLTALLATWVTSV